jgi:hypothetical protein
MPELIRSRDPHRANCWRIHYGDVPFKELALEARRCRDAAIGNARRDLTEDCGMILRFGEVWCCFDIKTSTRLAHAS